MKVDQYQDEAIRTLPNASHRDNVMTCALGLGEAGEVQNLVKKQWFHGHELNREKLVDELGDTLWYIAALASLYGVKLSDIMEYNINKLRKRYPEGFSSERSINRER
jgi:NTP pyrophosphatase (non-canonical NTP hydrolase)